jgi:hypothetical protein
MKAYQPCASLASLLVLWQPVRTDAQEMEEVPASRPLQPSIMVVPFARADQDMRTVLEQDEVLRVAVTKVKEAFDRRGFSTVDFRARVRQLQTDKAMEMENQSSLKQELIELSGADIWVETEANIARSSSGNGVTVLLTAFDAHSGLSLANKVGNSPRFYTEQFEKLAEKAVEGMAEDFLNTLQLKFDDMVLNGRPAALNITFAEQSDLDMDSFVAGQDRMLSEILEEWLAEHCFKGYYHIQGVTATKLLVDELRLPRSDEQGRPYRPTRFAAELRNFLRSLGLESTRDVQGGRIFITIQ